MMKAAQILLLAVAMVAVTDSLPLAAPSPEDVHPVIPLESGKDSLPSSGGSGEVEAKSLNPEVKPEDAASVAIVDAVAEQKPKEAKSAEPEVAKPIEDTPSIVLPAEVAAAAKPEEPKETIVEAPKEEKKIETPEAMLEEPKPIVARSEESLPKTEEINTAEVPIAIAAEKSQLTETKESLPAAIPTEGRLASGTAADIPTEERLASGIPVGKELPHEASSIVDSIIKDQIENQKQEESVVENAERVTRGEKSTPEIESPIKNEGGQEQVAIVTPVEQTSVPKLETEPEASIARSAEEPKEAEPIAAVESAQPAVEAAGEKVVEALKVAEQESRKVEDAVPEIKEEPAAKEESKVEEKEGSLILEDVSPATKDEEKKEEAELKEEQPTAAAEEKPKELIAAAADIAEELPNAEQLTDNNQPKKPEPETEKSEEVSKDSSEESASEESGEEKKVTKHDDDSSQEDSLEKSESGKVSSSEK